MSHFNYKEKVIEFINEIRNIIENKQESDYQKLTDILHKMFFYAEQYFIEKSLKYRHLPYRVQEINKEKEEVLSRLKSYAEAIEKLNKQTDDMLDFLSGWEKKLAYEDSLHSSNADQT